MRRKLIVDSSVFLCYAAYNRVYRLTNAVFTYGLILYVDTGLMDELTRNLPKVIQVKGVTPHDIFREIRNITIHVNPKAAFTDSPDPKDNFLFDLALQTGSEVIVSQEKALLGFAASPVAIHDIKWFKETFPVPL